MAECKISEACDDMISADKKGEIKSQHWPFAGTILVNHNSLNSLCFKLDFHLTIDSFIISDMCLQ